MFAPPRLYHITGAVFRIGSWVFLAGLILCELGSYRLPNEVVMVCLAATSLGRMAGSLCYAIERPPMWISVATDVLLVLGAVWFTRDYAQLALAISLGGSAMLPTVWLGHRLFVIKPFALLPALGGLSVWYVMWYVHSTPIALGLMVALVSWSWLIDLGIGWWAMAHWREQARQTELFDS